MTELSLYDIIKKLNERVTDLERRLSVAEAFRGHGTKHVPAPAPTPIDVVALRSQMVAQIRQYFDAHANPCRLYFLTRIYGKKLKALGLKAEDVLEPLVPDTLHRITTLQGTSVYVPAEGWDAATQALRAFWATARTKDIRKDIMDQHKALDEATLAAAKLRAEAEPATLSEQDVFGLTPDGSSDK